MTVPQVRTLSARRLYKAYKHSGVGIEQFANRVRDFHPSLAQTSVKQLTRWHGGQRPRNAEIVVAAYMAITGEPESFFYTTSDEEDEESRLRRIHQIAGQLRARGIEDLAAELQAVATEPTSREAVEVGR